MLQPPLWIVWPRFTHLYVLDPLFSLAWQNASPSMLQTYKLEAYLDWSAFNEHFHGAIALHDIQVQTSLGADPTRTMENIFDSVVCLYVGLCMGESETTAKA